MHIHPLLPLTASLVLGITWQALGIFPWLAIIIPPAIYIYQAFSKNKSHQVTYITLLAALFFLGGFRYMQQKQAFDAFEQATANKQCSVIAEIVDIEESHRRPGQTIFTLNIQELTHDTKIVPQAVGFNIQVSTKTSQPARVSDTVLCKNLFFRKNFHQDYKRYLIKEHLGGHLMTKEIFAVKNNPKHSLKRWFIEKRNNIVTNLQKKLSPTTFTLFASIFWGKKQVDPNLMDPIKESFKAWGLLHYLARSGLHVIIFILLWTWIMRLAPLPYNLKQLILLFVIFGYLAISWSSISFSRAVILFVLYRLCLLFDLQINALYLLALTGSIILLYNPYQLFFLDFQLSFGLTLALALFNALKTPNKNH